MCACVYVCIYVYVCMHVRACVYVCTCVSVYAVHMLRVPDMCLHCVVQQYCVANVPSLADLFRRYNYKVTCL